MSSVECIVGEGQQGVPKCLDGLFRVAVGLHAIREAFVLLVQFFLVLLTHGSTQQVGFTERESGGLLSRSHDLLLINNQAVGRV